MNRSQIWGIIFIAIGVIGGVIVGGIMQRHTAFLVAGLCVAAIGVLAITTTAKGHGSGQGKTVVALMDFQQLAWWGWALLIALTALTFGSFFLWPVR